MIFRLKINNTTALQQTAFRALRCVVSNELPTQHISLDLLLFYQNTVFQFLCAA